MKPNEERLANKDAEIFHSINSLWQTQYVTPEARTKRKELVRIFQGTDFLAIPFGSLIAAANNTSDFDLLIHGLYEWEEFDKLGEKFISLGDIQYCPVRLEPNYSSHKGFFSRLRRLFRLPDRVNDKQDSLANGQIRNAYDLRPKKLYDINVHTNLLLTPDSILGGNLELAHKIRLAVVKNMQGINKIDEEWSFMIEDFLGYYLSPKFLNRSGLAVPEAEVLVKKLKAALPSFSEYKDFLERNSGKVNF